MSPRRRRLGIGLAAGLLAAGTAAALLASAGGSPGSRPAAVRHRLGPVLLVPGYGGRPSTLARLAARIEATGRRAIIVRLPGNGTGSLIADAAALNGAVSRVLAAGAPPVDVVGYSAGGVTALVWVREDHGARKARRVVTLGSPFHGTAVAAVAAGFLPGACPAACQQLAPGSALLRGLDGAGAGDLPPWLSLWTVDDTTVVPPDSARLAGAINVPVQSVCPGLSVTHSQLPDDPSVTAMVLEAIGPGPLRRPTAADCRPVSS
jgi:triacylglycerol lipase